MAAQGGFSLGGGLLARCWQQVAAAFSRADERHVFYRARNILSILAICLTTGCSTVHFSSSEGSQLRAKHLITVTDDFIVEVYHNGVKVPDARRELLVERFGATVEKINVEVQRGDWLVFNVVNNRLRWGGAYYFGAAGILGENECGFVTDLDSGDWSVCDDPAAQTRFIKSKNYLSDNRPAKVEFPWGEGDAYMRQFAGNQWNGEPIWGRERNTWIKVMVE